MHYEREALVSKWGDALISNTSFACPIPFSTFAFAFTTGA
jgi:hypothetical protein